MIELTQPIVTPPVPPKTYNSVWINDIIIASPTPTDPIKAYIKVMPYNSETGEVDSDNPRAIQIENVEMESAENPALATAMSAIIAAVDSLIKSKNVF